ncbi:right-handed parallel beta-helix repeat-containing protein [Marinilabilia sp.]|uniref:right-handed parallel beta-helix repeat-containing protein n=1 Tax=Marinilabilia sp. TaxID=2021252 RepID=UPI0025BC9511|nr:right-handed parallel beta-helix repeat-containing protein [Marinilabilia sp.]
MKGLIYLIVIAIFTLVACDGENLIPSSDYPANQEMPENEDSSEVPVNTDEDSISKVVLPYDEIPEEEYTIDLQYWDIPSDGTQPVKTTDNLQAAIDWAVGEGYGIIRLPAGHFIVGKDENGAFHRGIKLKSNMAFFMDKDALIEMVPNNKGNYYTVAVSEQRNVVISGGTILGDRYDHTYTEGHTHGGGHCIAITHESENVTVENMRLSEATGDGILLQGYAGEGSSVKSIVIRENDIFDNRRQGISIVGGIDVLVEDNEIHHTHGTAPQFGIDIESEIYHSENITIRNNYFHHNKGGHIINFDAWDLVIEDNIMEDGEGFDHWRSVIYWNNTAPIIRNNEITFNIPSKGVGIAMYPNKYSKTNPDTTLISGNVLNGCGFYMYEGTDHKIIDNSITSGSIGLTDMRNVTLKDNYVEIDGSCGGMSLSNVRGIAFDNFLNGILIHLPLDTEIPFDGRACEYKVE